MSRALEHARNRLVLQTHAPSVTDMLEIIIAETLHALQDHPRRFRPDRTIRGHIDRLCGFFDQIDGSLIRGPVQNHLDQILEAAETDAARRALSARLRVTDMQKRRGEINRTESGLARRDPPLQILVEFLYGPLRTVLRIDA